VHRCLESDKRPPKGLTSYPGELAAIPNVEAFVSFTPRLNAIGTRMFAMVFVPPEKNPSLSYSRALSLP
jgi:hypothetical protein